MLVRKGYTVIYGARRFPSGSVIPDSIVDTDLINKQSWKLEDSANGKESTGSRSEEQEELKEQPQEKEDTKEEKEVIKDIAVNRMMKAKTIKKKGKR
jgi:hypothetical protein